MDLYIHRNGKASVVQGPLKLPHTVIGSERLESPPLSQRGKVCTDFASLFWSVFKAGVVYLHLVLASCWRREIVAGPEQQGNHYSTIDNNITDLPGPFHQNRLGTLRFSHLLHPVDGATHPRLPFQK